MSNSQVASQKESKFNLSVPDTLFLGIFVAVFALVLLYFADSNLQYLFTMQPALGESLFSYLAFVLILFGGIIWGLYTLIVTYPKVRGSEFRKLFFSNAVGFIGLRKTTSKDLLYVGLAIFGGFVFNFLSTLIAAYLVGGTTTFGSSSPTTPYIIAQNMVAAPIFEELLFRAFFIGFFLKAFGKSKVSLGVCLVMSSLVFGFIHVGPTWQLLTKTVGGFVLGTIYLARWRKNYLASAGMHFGMNAIGTFMIVNF